MILGDVPKELVKRGGIVSACTNWITVENILASIKISKGILLLAD